LKWVADPLGLGTIVQLVPFHNSVSVERFWEDPTAMQNVGPLHDTDPKELSELGEVLALGTIDHVETVAAGDDAGTASTPAATHTMPTAMGPSRRRPGRILDRCGG
jgi:hypothetical protein